MFCPTLSAATSTSHNKICKEVGGGGDEIFDYAVLESEFKIFVECGGSAPKIYDTQR